MDDLQYPDGSLHELDDGTPVTVNTILLALLTGTVRGILYDPDGVILRFGRARRLFTPDQRAALQAKYRRCAHPWGCNSTGRRLQADHTPEWEDGGLTDTDDADLKCGPHNRLNTTPKADHPQTADRTPTNEDARPGWGHGTPTTTRTVPSRDPPRPYAGVLAPLTPASSRSASAGRRWRRRR